MQVFLTGGTGLVGSHVAERLTAKGDAVKALVRSGADDKFLRSLGAEIWARDELGWVPRVSHDEGVRRAVEWYLNSGRS